MSVIIKRLFEVCTDYWLLIKIPTICQILPSVVNATDRLLTGTWAVFCRELCSSCRCHWGGPRPPRWQTGPPPVWQSTGGHHPFLLRLNRAQSVATHGTSWSVNHSPTYPPGKHGDERRRRKVVRERLRTSGEEGDTSVRKVRTGLKWVWLNKGKWKDRKRVAQADYGIRMSGGVMFFYRSVNPLSHRPWHDALKWPEILSLEQDFSGYSRWSKN